VEIRETVDDKQILDALQRLKEAVGGHLADPMRQIGRSMKTSTQMRFRDQVGPDGKPWVPSIRVKKHGGQTLSLTARLRNSWTYIADNNSVTWGTNVAYAAPLHFGSKEVVTIRAFIRRVSMVYGRPLKRPVSVRVHSFVRHMNLPARPMIGVSAGDREAILTIMRTHLSRAAHR
jgi:phage virion morphogenesis protein